MLIALESPPAVAEPLFWTDFVELRALIHPDRCYSRGDLLGLAQRLRDTAPAKAFDAQLRWRDIANFAGVRRLEFADCYPFRVSEDEDTLELADEGTSKHTLYLNLLLASLMRHIPHEKRGALARYFEETCREVFRKLMPEGSEIRDTWAHGGAEAAYAGHLYDKMVEIAADLRCSANFCSRDFQRTDSGDGNIDLIAWHPMADERAGIPIAFAQCGCSKEDWRFKHLEVSPAKHQWKLPVMHPWSAYYFMPVDLRHPDGDWAYKADIGAAIIVDRLRLTRLSSQYELFEALPALPLLAEVQEFQYL